MTSLENRIADALADENSKRSVFSDLLIEIDAALPLNAKETEATRVQMLNPAYPHPAIAKSTIDKLELERQRLESAQVILRDRYRKAERQETFAAIRPRYNALVAEHDECSEALGKLYCAFVESVVPLLASAAKLNTAIRRINAETHAKGFTEIPTIPTIGEHLIDKMVLPIGNGQNYWPSPGSENAFAVAMSEMMAVPRHDARYSADWSEGKRMENAAKLSDWEKRNALQAEQQASAKCEFEKSKQQGDDDN